MADDGGSELVFQNNLYRRDVKNLETPDLTLFNSKLLPKVKISKQKIYITQRIRSIDMAIKGDKRQSQIFPPFFFPPFLGGFVAFGGCICDVLHFVFVGRAGVFVCFGLGVCEGR